MEHRRCGALRSSEERLASLPRYESRIRTRFLLPKSVDLRPNLLRIRDQGNTSECVAFSVACMKEYQEFREDAIREYFSPQFIYDRRKNTGDGMYLPDALTILKNVGCPLESAYPFMMPGLIHKDAAKQAANYRINSYTLINSMQGLKQALNEQGPCPIVFPVYNYGPQFWRSGSKDGGGHCVTVVGYNDEMQHFIVRNSWGADWGDGGYTYYPYGDWGCHWEVYSAIDSESSPITPLPDPDPRPDKKGCRCVMM